MSEANLEQVHKHNDGWATREQQMFAYQEINRQMCTRTSENKVVGPMVLGKELSMFVQRLITYQCHM